MEKRYTGTSIALNILIVIVVFLIIFACLFTRSSAYSGDTYIRGDAPYYNVSAVCVGVNSSKVTYSSYANKMSNKEETTWEKIEKIVYGVVITAIMMGFVDACNKPTSSNQKSNTTRKSKETSAEENTTKKKNNCGNKQAGAICK